MDKIAGFEPWDTIVLHGFGFVNTADVMAQFTQDGADAVFDHAHGEIRLVGYDVAQLDMDNFQLA
jgi:hypothetical protein